jgi:hypothetical protein
VTSLQRTTHCKDVLQQGLQVPPLIRSFLSQVRTPSLVERERHRPLNCFPRKRRYFHSGPRLWLEKSSTYPKYIPTTSCCPSNRGRPSRLVHAPLRILSYLQDITKEIRPRRSLPSDESSTTSFAFFHQLSSFRQVHQSYQRPEPLGRANRKETGIQTHICSELRRSQTHATNRENLQVVVQCPVGENKTLCQTKSPVRLLIYLSNALLLSIVLQTAPQYRAA